MTDDHRSRLVWRWIAVATSWLAAGYAILLAYYWAVATRRTPLGRSIGEG